MAGTTQLTGAEITSAITTKLRAAFTTQQIANIYKDPQAQNFIPPCLVVKTIELEVTPELKGRSKRHYMIDIRGHYSGTDINSWSAGVADKIIDSIRTITIDGFTIKSRNFQARIEEGVLHVITEYSFMVKYVEAAAPHMATVTIDVD